tara:strand:+ start:3773 stop:4984 length:1212 start_codon:yes stop_codon:yes gene_type:complete
LKTFVLVFGFLCGLTLLQDLANHLADFRDSGASMGEAFRYYLLLLPGFFPWLIPISLFVSILLSFGGMARRNEIVAIRATGTSLPKASRLVLFSCLVLAGCVFGLNASWAPWSIEETRKIKDRIQRAGQPSQGSLHGNSESIRNVHFDNRRDSRLWHFGWFNEVTLEGRDVHVFVHGEAGVELYRIHAAVARRDEASGGWIFRDGNYTSFPSSAGLARYSPEKGKMIFRQPSPSDASLNGTSDKNGLPEPNEMSPLNRIAAPKFFKDQEIRLLDFNEDPALFALLRKKPKDLSLRELTQILEAFPEDEQASVRPFAIRRREVLLAPLGCMFAGIIAIPFAAIGPRRNPAVGLARAFGLFIGYYLVLTGANSLGQAGVVSADLAGSLPSIAMACVAGYLLWRAR